MSFPIDGPVCVTGATGYVAGHVIRELLERGATVRGTARNHLDEAKVGHLLKMAAELPGTLELFSADLNSPGSFDEAISGCEVVIHTASPFIIGSDGDPTATFIDPAVKGTTHVLDAVDAATTVRRVVLTSSIAAVVGENSEGAGRTLDESDWNESSTLQGNPYYLSKKLAEQAGWERQKAQGRWDLVVINPGFVMGPSLTDRNDSASIDFVLALIDGRRKSGMWDMIAAWVDVRDVATAHVEAAVRADASGRHLLVSECTSVWTVIDGLREDFGDRLKLPGTRIPKWLAYLLAPFIGYSWSYVRDNVAVPLKVQNRRSRDELGIQYRPLRQTMKDHVDQLIRDGLYAP